jgi:hypothetical protein
MKTMGGWIFGAALASLAVLLLQEASAWVHRGWGGVSAGRAGEGWAHRGYYGGVTHTDFVGVHNTYVVGGYHPGGC